ncbi:hypothetical protein SARC_12427, partial [Sphaeroforma arctica JP610]
GTTTWTPSDSLKERSKNPKIPLLTPGALNETKITQAPAEYASEIRADSIEERITSNGV